MYIRERDGKKSRREREEILFHSLTHNSHTLVQMSVWVKVMLRRSHDQSYDFKNTEREVTSLSVSFFISNSTSTRVKKD